MNQNQESKEEQSSAHSQESPDSQQAHKLSPNTSDSDKIKYPSKDGTYLRQLYNQPLVTTLSSFSQVANLVRNPYELINNVDEFVRQASGNHRKQQRMSDDFARVLNQNRNLSTPTSPVQQEMDTFVGSAPNQSPSPIDEDQEPRRDPIPIPVLPSLDCSSKRGRLEPLTIDEYESKFRQAATDLELIERVFLGSMSCNQLRAALWPYLFGIVKHRGRFDKISDSDGHNVYLFVENEGNYSRWRDLQELYTSYEKQWKAITADQETRFSLYRERKSLIERDVIRCDRLHPFYKESPRNLDNLTKVLMTYMMYDFDIGYVQGMSDLAGPILFMYKGDVMKSFWVFVEVMKLFRRNFEKTQRTIQFQLSCLHNLIRSTDPIFAQYLAEQETSNCFFAFRAIVCQFKRELMKEDEDDYSKVLFLWDTIWCVKRRLAIKEELDALDPDCTQGSDFKSTGDICDNRAAASCLITSQPTSSKQQPTTNLYHPLIDSDQSDTPRRQLFETEIFVLALCLSMIRRERDIILAMQLDSTDIHLHFINPKLADDLNSFIEHAINIYSFMKNDFDLTKLTGSITDDVVLAQQQATNSASNDNPESPQGSAEGYDFLSDFLIIGGASGS